MSTAGEARGPVWHKVQTSDPALVAELMSQGAQFVADYGSAQLLAVAQPPPSLTGNPQVEVHDEYDTLVLNAAHLNTKARAVQALRGPVGTFRGKRTHLVQFAGPVLPEWRAALTNAGVQIVTYIPFNAYLVYGDAASLARVQELAATAPFVQWEAPYAKEFRIHPAARAVDAKGRARRIGTDEFAVQLIADAEANAATMQLLDGLKGKPFRKRELWGPYLNVVVSLAAADVTRVADQPDVISIQPYFPPHKLDERQDQIMAGNLTGGVPSGAGYLAWLAAKGFTQAQFTASGFVVDVVDSGIDDGTTAPHHPGLHLGGGAANNSRVVYNRLEGTPNNGSTLSGCDGHGNLNAHIVGGYDSLTGFPFADSAGFRYGLGVCPFVKLGSSVVFDPDSYTNPNFDDLFADAYNGGARVSNNSWGGPGSGAYDMDAQHFDALVRDAEPAGSSHPAAGNQAMTVVVAAGNDGAGAQTVGSPGTAKNVITVGAAEGVQAFGGPDGSSVTDAEADNANDIASFSSRGPCADGRHKPDLMGPGTHISGGVPQAANPGPTGTADPCFIANNTGISGGPNGNVFFPANQQFYSASSGTSHSTPAVSGACALVRQYFINQFTNPPSPAMTKAYLLNSARYLTGVDANDTLWSDTQGMGEADLGRAFDGAARILRDQRAADLFTASGQTRALTGVIQDTGQPFRVTLAWTDAPGSTTANAYNNDLDLTVTCGGVTYKGNVFNHAYSMSGGAADKINNVESVFLPAGVSGAFVVTVTAANINSDGVPGNGTPLDQDFALVVYNGTETRIPVVQGEGASLLNESCLPGNGVVDPGETVTVNFALQNFGVADTTNLVATLAAGGGVLVPSSPQSYGVLVAGGPAVSQPFTFTAKGSCGTVLTATLQLQDGAANLGTVTFDLPLGVALPFNAFSESFDTAVVPNLPPGWTAVDSGAGAAWVSSSPGAGGSLNCVYVSEPAAPGEGDLLSPIIPIASPAALLSFQNDYELEADNTSGVGYDGGVLEIKIGSGPFTDILAAGGSFVSGGYTLGLDSTGGNPLSGRQAWSGSAGGFTNTTVRLPTAAAGQNVQFKWRMGTDSGNFFGGTGWYVDSISLQDNTYSCCASSVTPAQLKIAMNGANVSVSFLSLAGASYSLEYKNALTDPQWTSLPGSVAGNGGTVSLTDTNAPGGTRFYRVVAQ